MSRYSKQLSRTVLCFIIFCGVLFLKNCLFQYFSFRSLLLGSIKTDPAEFWLFWLNKLVFPLAIASMVFFFRKKQWTIWFSVVLDFWILANLIYYRSNGFPLDAYALSMTGNMSGFWGSVLGLLEWKDLTFFGLTVIYSLVLIAIERRGTGRCCSFGVAMLILALLVQAGAMVGLNKRWNWAEKPIISPYSTQMKVVAFGPEINLYCYNFSVMHLMVYDVVEGVPLVVGKLNQESVDFTDAEREMINERMEVSGSPVTPYRDTLVIILVESFESWAVRPEITPNICRFIENRNDVLYADKVTSQIGAGTSADGQMIINTGLLPLAEGAACYRFPFSTYPGLAQPAEGRAITLCPHYTSMWNQAYMSDAYGYDATERVGETDPEVFEALLDRIVAGYQVVQTMTLSSHLPFEGGSRNSTLSLPADMPDLMSKYLKCINNTDRYLSRIFSEVEDGGCLHNATVVITGDHKIFHRDRAEHFQKYSDSNSMGYDIIPNYCPLIIRSPHIGCQKTVDEVCWQMDIYPTLRAVLGEEHFPWAGFGVDLLDDSARTARDIDADTASYLSDKIIRGDYFGRNARLAPEISK